MKLYLALAVLMLALVAYTEAQDFDFQERLEQFKTQMTQLGDTIAAKTQEAYNSDTSMQIRGWVTEKLAEAQKQLQDMVQ